MPKVFQPQQRVTVIDTASTDNGKSGIVETCDADKQTCSVLLDGDDTAKPLRYDQIDWVTS